MDEDDETLTSRLPLNSSLATWVFPIARSLGNCRNHLLYASQYSEPPHYLGNSLRFYGQLIKTILVLGIEFYV